MSDLKKEFGKVYDKYIEKIYRFVFLKVDTKETAQDITSEAFLRCWEVFKTTPERIDNVQAFLYQIARNLVVDHYRQKGRAKLVSTDEVSIIDPRLDINEKACDNSDLANIKVALSRINGDYKDVILLHYVEDLPIPDIAKSLDKSEGAVRVMLHRALEALKSEVKEA